jgi:hypothetical protein
MRHIPLNILLLPVVPVVAVDRPGRIAVAVGAVLVGCAPPLQIPAVAVLLNHH